MKAKSFAPAWFIFPAYLLTFAALMSLIDVREKFDPYPILFWIVYLLALGLCLALIMIGAAAINRRSRKYWEVDDYEIHLS